MPHPTPLSTSSRRPIREVLMGISALLVATGCGARTGVGGGDSPGGDASVADTSSDRTEIDGGLDVIVTDAGCVDATDCDDRIACTLDRCDDGVFCNGPEACDAVKGCVQTPAPTCSDGIACSVDSCNEAKKGCDHVADDSLCPISHTCDLALGCQARALAHSGTTLYEIRLPSGQVKTLGATGPQLTDIALHPTNVLYGIGFNVLYTVNQTTGVATFFKNTAAGNINGADVAPNGSLYVAGGSSLYTLDLGTGNPSFAGAFPSGRTSSGDLAFVGTRLVATANGPSGDDLVVFDLGTKTSTVVGAVGFTCVWGLAAFGPTLYGLTCNGQVLSIDPFTGKGTQLNKVSVAFWGASAR